MSHQSYENLFAQLTDTIDQFVDIVRNKQLNLMATDEWTVKDILCHIVFWHESYAANYHATAQQEPPCIPQEPAYKLNHPGVSKLRNVSMEKLIQRLYIANDSLFTSIVEKKVPRMTYHSKGRTYETGDFLKMIDGHIKTHMTQIRRAKHKKLSKNAKKSL
ncbi:ClbS/DfsB family four-helix bundle protein [candidate division WWE3 bacterium]|nr:ClbS/DfsB family four-helix bundle protein [candidate division WWE3 bacterium]